MTAIDRVQKLNEALASIHYKLQPDWSIDTSNIAATRANIERSIDEKDALVGRLRLALVNVKDGSKISHDFIRKLNKDDAINHLIAIAELNGREAAAALEGL